MTGEFLLEQTGCHRERGAEAGSSWFGDSLSLGFKETSKQLGAEGQLLGVPLLVLKKQKLRTTLPL